jgi:hypothetical protein
MTLIEDLGGKFRKTYIVTACCTNCKVVQDVRVPKGETIEEYFKSERGKCDNCGTACLEQYKKPNIK